MIGALDATITRPLTLNILDSTGKVIRSFTSTPPARPARAAGEEGGGEDEEGRYRPTYPATLDATPGMHRFTWDLRYSGAPAVPSAAAPPPPAAPQGSALAAAPSGPKPGEPAPGGLQPGAPNPTQPRFPNGPVAAPGTYTVVLTAGSFTQKQPLTVIEDPRVTADGVTTADLSAQLEHNLRVLHLVNDTNLLVSRVTAAQAALKKTPDTAKSQALQPLADALITPRIRYSQPALQTHVTYLYSENNTTDQKLGHDAVERYVSLRKQIDALTSDLNRVLGPPTQADLQHFMDDPPNAVLADDDNQ